MKLNSIQCLRAVAALLVVYAHSIDLQMGFSVSKQQNFFHLQNFGAIGVDLFFVISGFIITYVANKYSGIEQGFNFLVNRFKRINPVYYIASILSFAVLVFQFYVLKQSGSISFDKTLDALTDTILIVPLSVDGSFNPFLRIGWTLAFEWFFYTLFFLLILARIKHKVLLLGIVITGLVITGVYFKYFDIRYAFITNPIMLEFLTGVGICWIYLNVQRIPTWISIICSILGIIGYTLLIFLGYGNIDDASKVLSGMLSMTRFLLWGLPSAFLAAGCIFLERNNRLTAVWNNKWMLLAGDASYSIYLIHMSVFALLPILYKKIGFFWQPDIAAIAQLIIAVIIGVGFYKLVEKPLLKSLQNTKVKKPDAYPVPNPV